ncbi:hypothetical protein BC628DRAFT_1371384 [Trametes gibbosa]|nr:hypothetical protein BC628DRAFT_1371384 [Trametes gibbosa]
MTSLHEYVARYRKVAAYPPGLDPRISTGAPTARPIPTHYASCLPFKNRQYGACLEEQNHQPEGVGEDSYARVHAELDPKHERQPTLHDRVLRLQRKKVIAVCKAREDGVFWTHYHKMVERMRKDAAQGIDCLDWVEGEEEVDSGEDSSATEDDVDEGDAEHREFRVVQGTSRITVQEAPMDLMSL